MASNAKLIKDIKSTVGQISETMNSFCATLKSVELRVSSVERMVENSAAKKQGNSLANLDVEIENLRINQDKRFSSLESRIDKLVFRNSRMPQDNVANLENLELKQNKCLSNLELLVENVDCNKDSEYLEIFEEQVDNLSLKLDKCLASLEMLKEKQDTSQRNLDTDVENIGYKQEICLAKLETLLDEQEGPKGTMDTDVENMTLKQDKCLAKLETLIERQERPKRNVDIDVGNMSLKQDKCLAKLEILIEKQEGPKRILDTGFENNIISFKQDQRFSNLESQVDTLLFNFNGAYQENTTTLKNLELKQNKCLANLERVVDNLECHKYIKNLEIFETKVDTMNVKQDICLVNLKKLMEKHEKPERNLETDIENICLKQNNCLVALELLRDNLESNKHGKYQTLENDFQSIGVRQDKNLADIKALLEEMVSNKPSLYPTWESDGNGFSNADKQGNQSLQISSYIFLFLKLLFQMRQDIIAQILFETRIIMERMPKTDSKKLTLCRFFVVNFNLWLNSGLPQESLTYDLSCGSFERRYRGVCLFKKKGKIQIFWQHVVGSDTSSIAATIMSQTDGENLVLKRSFEISDEVPGIAFFEVDCNGLQRAGLVKADTIVIEFKVKI